jgi:oligopeptide/dipeptide ABC transporter ATP-binding protein
VARLIVRLEKPNAGKVLVHGRDISRMSSQDQRLYRREVQMVFQDPYASLDSRMTIEDCITEPLTVQNVGNRRERSELAGHLIEKVGLDPSFAARYPSQMSGGQRQRVAIARALALSPSVIVADEPTSALDVSVRAQVINLLCDLQDQSNLSFAFISHDLATVRHIAHSIAVMYLGKVVESGPSEELFERPLHPYTRALLSAVPIPDPVAEARRPIELLQGDPPSPINPPSGCRFSTRCPLATDRCREEEPQLTSYGPDRMAACHYVDGAVV